MTFETAEDLRKAYKEVRIHLTPEQAEHIFKTISNEPRKEVMGDTHVYAGVEISKPETPATPAPGI